MIQKYSHWISRFRYGMVIIWCLLTAASMFWLPSLSKVVAHESTNFLPNSNSVIVAQNLLNTIHPSGSKKQAQSSAVIGISNSHGLTQSEKSWFAVKLSALDGNPAHYGIVDVHDVDNTDKGLASSFVSKDGTTQIALVDFPGLSSDKATTRTVKNLHTFFQSPPGNARVVFTGDALIEQDDATISEQGASKSAVVTVILVLAILLLVFRSVVAPLITLVAIALSFLVSSSVVAWFATHGLPVSTFTQTFLVAILFGAGTDYTMILLNRYREELTKPAVTREEALAASLGAIGKTVVFSGLTVLVSFAVLYFANFGLYRSAVGVAVGVGITLVCCLTFIPALMSILGPHLYCPKHPVAGSSHRPSKLWLASANLAIRKPWWTLGALAVVLAPVAMLFTNDRSFDPMADIPSAPSVQGFQIVGKAFGQGEVLPMNVVLKSSQNLRSSEGLATIEQVSKAILGDSIVNKVESASRPEGTIIPQFQLATQNQLAANGLSQVLNGTQKLQQGLSSQASLLNNQSSQINQLSQGAEQVASGSNALANGLQEVTTKTGQLASGAAATAVGQQKIDASLQQLASGSAKLTAGLTSASGGSSQISTGIGQVDSSSQQLASVASQLANAIAQYEKSHPEVTGDASWQAIAQMATSVASRTASLSAATHQLVGASQSLATSLAAISSGQTALAQSNQQISSGLSQVASASGKVGAGMGQLASGSKSLTSGLAQLSSGANSLQSGSTQVATGVRQLTQSVNGLPSGLNSVASAVGKVGSGVNSVKKALSSSQSAKTIGEPGFYVPASALSNASLQQAMNAYISPNGHVASFTVTLKINPYSSTSIAAMPGIQQAAQSALAISPFHTGTIMLAGVTPTQSALNAISNQDFVHTVSIILIVIFVLLAVMLRSILMPLYIILSLTGSYFVTMGILQSLTVHIMHKPGLSWTVPFFVFLLLVALGVDYSIFLMSRFQEIVKTSHSPAEAMRMAMGHMGNVIFSAAIIMAGTFGSLAVSGVTPLVEIGLGIIIGLLLYTTIMLGLFVPSCAAVIGEGYRWPFSGRKALD